MKEEEERRKLIEKVESLEWDSPTSALFHIFFLAVSGVILSLFLISMIVLLVQGMRIDAAYNLCKGILHNTAGDVFPGFSSFWVFSLVMMIIEEVFFSDYIYTIIRAYIFVFKRRIRRWLKK